MNGNGTTRSVHENARECTISAGGATASAVGGDVPDDPVHEDARECTIPADGDGHDGTSDVVGDAANADALRERQRTAIGLILLGRPYGDVARAVGVDPSTLYRWRRDETFRAEIERRGRDLWDGAAVRLRALVHPALDVLEAEVHDEYDRSRVRAAGMIFRFADLRKSVPPGKAQD